MKNVLLSLSVCGVFLSSPLVAADMKPIFKAPPIAPSLPAYSWTGVYAGGTVGYSWRDPSISFGGSGDAPGLFASGYLPQSVTVDPRGFLGGLLVGYNIQSANLVYGVEADISKSSIKDSASATGVTTRLFCDPFTCGASGTVAAEQKLDWIGTARGRFGVLATPHALFYATGGLAYGHAKVSASVTSAPTTSFPQEFFQCGTERGSGAPPCASGSASAWLVGWTVGGGLEYAIGAGWSLRGEYLYYDIGTLSAQFTDPFTPNAFAASAEFKGHIVRTGAAYRF